MEPQFQLKLGNFVFQEFEIPSKITGLGGKQTIAKSQLIGGLRVVDAMGADNADLSWDGRFRGIDALKRAQTLDRMRKGGEVFQLRWGGLYYEVVISDFTFDYLRMQEIEYRITVVVVYDSNTVFVPPAPAESLVQSDLDAASKLTNVGQNILDGVNSLSTALEAVGPLAMAATSTVVSLASQATSIASEASSAFVAAQSAASAIIASPGGNPAEIAANLVALDGYHDESIDAGGIANLMTRAAINLTGAAQ
ncbi:hypothetical protein [Methylosinus sp. PW1]|uniref:hypothetical protein n=1 Tax=Methylosinus sp. PW1 TaxID=107636 RepID=UPI00068B7BAD|nr:hypothetical protein [Methylosinus sp. PW1]